MSLEAFKIGVAELYQGEVIGEVFFYRMLAQFPDPEHRYPLATLLQLETEGKARLRPLVMELGVDVVEHDDARAQGEAFAKESLERVVKQLFFPLPK